MISDESLAMNNYYDDKNVEYRTGASSVSWIRSPIRLDLIWFD